MLLLAEAELCNAVGLTEDDYWHFVELTEAYNGERSEEYALIPDVRNDPVSIITSLVVGAALSAVSALLTPKPKQEERKTPENLQTESITGRSKFAPQSSFDSLQELASLGQVVPLVFTRRGVRVNSSLLWSQMISLGNGQQLRALMMFSSGEIEGRPDFAGYAIGDTTLSNYTNAKLALYFKPNGGRPRERSSDRYSEGSLSNVSPTDAFSIFWDAAGTYRPYFSGSRTPSTQTEFGCYAPAPNGQRWRPLFDNPTIVDNPDSDNNKENKERMRAKRNKARAKVPYRAAVIKNSGGYVTYRLDGSQDSGNGFEPWGTDDFKQSVNGAKESVDSSFSVGSQYMIGTALTIATSVPPNPWVAGYTKDCKFKIIENGAITTAGVLDETYAADNLTIQSVAIGTISNNRKCEVTEIGIKSTVWGQVNGYANMNGYPGEDIVQEIGDGGGSFSLGSMTKYLRRISFFQLFTRPLGSNGKWTNISGGTLFCVEGNTPQAQYNYIRIAHPLGQWEFRLRPYPGNAAKRNYENKSVYQLRPGRQISYVASGRQITFEGKSLYLDALSMSNQEWVLGKPPVTTDAVNVLKNNWNPYDAVSDYPLVDAEKKSHMDSPEHSIVYVNEQVSQNQPNYGQLAIAGLRMNSALEWTSFSSLSAYFKRGVKVNRIYAGGYKATNLMPEIAYALLTDATLGAGTLVGADQVDVSRMASAARFCAANGFYWDGIITERVNLRQWIFENAGYCLLDFTIIGGRFSLVPSVPMNSNGTINRNAKPSIKALFTDGNIRNMKVSFLSPEERQLFRASVLWRQEKENGFPQTRTLNIRLSNAQGGNAADPMESFDMSGFCTSQDHALTFAKYALKLRKEVDHGVTFETTPQAAMNLAPGDHFRLVPEVTHTSRFNNGSIGPDGSITAADELNGSYSILYWEPGTTGVKRGTLKASDNKTKQGSLFGVVFTVSNKTTVNRVYKCETLTYADDGLVEVAGSHEPLTSDGEFAVLNWGSKDFLVETN